MTIHELFIMSNQELGRVLAQMTPDKAGIPMPPAISWRPGTLEQAIKYHTYDDAWVPDVLAGKTADQVGDTYEWLQSDDNADVMGNYAKYNQRAIEAVRDFTDLAGTVHFSYGDFPAEEGLRHITSFRAFRSYDLAKLIGVDTTMKPEFVQALLEEFTPHIEVYRQMGVFPAALPVADDADPQTKLLAMVGRS